MPDMTASIPHQLTRVEARRRIQAHMDTTRRQPAAMFMVTSLQETWTGDTMDFSLKAMGQSVSGQVTVDDRSVHVKVTLPIFLSLFAGTVRQQLEQQGGRLLAGPDRK
jgi:hypothetical protein